MIESHRAEIRWLADRRSVATTSHAKTDHEDCLSLGCCGPTCAYHDTIHPGHQH